MTVRLAYVLLLLGGCGGGAVGRAAPAVPAVQCGADEVWDGSRCRGFGGDLAGIERGVADLGEFRAKAALEKLERARRAGPYPRDLYARLYEQLGIAYSYEGQTERALDAFDMLLALFPGHAISYHLGPKPGMLFERARERAQQRGAPSVRVTWPRGVTVEEPVPVEIEVVADPKSFLSRARLYARREGEPSYRHVDVELPPPGSYRSILLPPVAPEAESPQVLQLYLSGFDERGNEVLRWGSAERPTEVGLDYRPVIPWYRKWWTWALGAAVVGTATGVTVYAVTREPPSEVGGKVIFTAR